MKEFWIYTGLRFALLAVVFVVVTGVWMLIADDGVFLFWPLLVAAVISAGLSVVVLRGPRERFAQSIQDRAAASTARVKLMEQKQAEAAAAREAERAERDAAQGTPEPPADR